MHQVTCLIITGTVTILYVCILIVECKYLLGILVLMSPAGQVGPFWKPLAIISLRRPPPTPTDLLPALAGCSDVGCIAA